MAKRERQDPNLPLLSIDLLTEHPMDFETMFAEAREFDLFGVPVRVCSKKHLIEMKSSSGRQIDLEDVRALEETQDEEA
jgi:hypothetical protein